MVKFKLYSWNFVNWLQQSMLMPGLVRKYLLAMMGCNIHRTAGIAAGVFIGSNRIHWSKNVYLNINCFLDGSEDIIIEEFVRFGPYVKILTGSHTINPGVLRRSGESVANNLPVTIKRGSWIGMGAIVLPGVTIAEGCVISSGSVVVRSTESNGMYAGAPAKRIKDLPLN